MTSTSDTGVLTLTFVPEVTKWMEDGKNVVEVACVAVMEDMTLVTSDEKVVFFTLEMGKEKQNIFAENLVRWSTTSHNQGSKRRYQRNGRKNIFPQFNAKINILSDTDSSYEKFVLPGEFVVHCEATGEPKPT